MLLQEVVNVASRLRSQVETAGPEKEFNKGFVGVVGTLNETNVPPSQHRLEMGNWREALKKSCVCSIRQVPNQLNGSVP